MRILAIVLVIVAIVCMITALAFGQGWIAAIPKLLATGLSTIGISGLTAWGLAAVGLTAFAVAAIVDHDTAAKMIDKVTATVGGAVASVGKAAGTAVAGLVTGATTAVTPLFSSIAGWALGGLGLYLAFKMLSKPPASPPPSQPPMLEHRDVQVR